MRSIPPLDAECFFIGPIGLEGSPERKRSDTILSELVAKAAEDLGLEAVRGDRLAEPGQVTAQVIRHLTEARAAVADVTGSNPNVFYELAVRQSAGRPVVLIARVGERLPFDIQGMRTIFYDDEDPASLRKSSEELSEQMRRSYPAGKGDVAEFVALSYSQRLSTPAGYDIGCRVGRRHLECGILEVAVPTAGLPSAGEVHVADEVSPVLSVGSVDNRLWKLDKPRFLDAFHGTVSRLIRAAANAHVQVRTIGVAVPGAVRIAESRFSTPVEGVAFDAGERIGRELVDHLCAEIDRDTLERVFGTSDARSLEMRVHLDNDARCATRWLATEHGADPLWRDFCCIFVGAGVGSGLVLDGDVYYGTYQRAGEVGHMTMHLEDRLSIDGISLPRRLCSCGKRAFHFETLAGVGGLGHLACALDGEKLTEIRRLLNPSMTPDRLPAESEWNIDAYDEAGFDVLRAFGERLHFRDEYEEFLMKVLNAYAKVFGVGVAALIDILDVGRVALCGDIPEFIMHSGELRDRLSTLPGAALVEPAKVAIEWGAMSEWGWRGAALLSRDPDYLARR